jgi:putative acetyltransferase
MRSEDARAFLEVHHKAVRELAADSYPSDVIEAWAPLPITERHVQFVCSNADQEFRLIAELNGEIVGIGCLVPQNHELRACYACRQQAGRASDRPFSAKSNASRWTVGRQRFGQTLR